MSIQLDRVTIKDLAEATGRTPRAIYRQIERGALPAPINLGRRNKFWLRQTLEQFFAEQGKCSISKA